MDKFDSTAKFLGKINELKFVYRWQGIEGIRDESTGAHSWRMAMLAMMWACQMPSNFNLGHALKIIAVHDIPEVIEGDTTFDKIVNGQVDKDTKHAREMTAMKGMLDDLDDPELEEEILSLYVEYDECKTLEAKFAKVIDKAEAAFHGLDEIGVEKWKVARGGLGAFITHLNSACGLVPQLDPFLLKIKQRQFAMCQELDIPWKPEYNGPADWAYADHEMAMS